uniref:Uncharacterized protein n=1 Tax=Pararge aegeria TaxID=116150 RepID=S4P271_9NEOP
MCHICVHSHTNFKVGFHSPFHPGIMVQTKFVNQSRRTDTHKTSFLMESCWSGTLKYFQFVLSIMLSSDKISLFFSSYSKEL